MKASSRLLLAAPQVDLPGAVAGDVLAVVVVLHEHLRILVATKLRHLSDVPFVASSTAVIAEWPQSMGPPQAGVPDHGVKLLKASPPVFGLEETLSAASMSFSSC